MKLKIMLYKMRFNFLEKEVIRDIRRTEKYTWKVNQNIEKLEKINDEMKREVGME